MNSLNGTIFSIYSSSTMSMVDIAVGTDHFSVIVIDTPQTASYLKEGQPVKLVFKETEVILANNVKGNLSVTNRFKAKIIDIKKDILLSQIIIEYQGKPLTSLINTSALNMLNLMNGETIDWLVESNEISLSIDIK